MRTVFYWLTRWPWLWALVAFFTIAFMLPPFTWWIRTPLLLVLTLAALIVGWGIKTNIAERMFLENLIANVESEHKAPPK